MKKIWQVSIYGHGFLRQNSKMGFELGGFVEAIGPDEAFSKAVDLARRQYAELDQAKKQDIPRAVINAEEILEFNDAPQGEIDKVEVYWFNEKSV